jgi:hypothetical protein
MFQLNWTRFSGVACALILMPVISGLFFSAVYSQDNDAEAKINSLMPDFYAYWEKARNEPPEVRIELWDSLFEAKHRDFYRQMVYEGLEGDRLEQMKAQKLKAFLEPLTDADIDRMKDDETRLKRLILEALSDLRSYYPWATETTTHYLIPSLNTSTGDARPFEGDMVACYGVELTNNLGDDANIKALIVHETFHVYHFRRVVPHLARKYGSDLNMNNIMSGEGPILMVFIEGLAIIAEEAVYPGVPKPGIFNHLMPDYQGNFEKYASEFLGDLDSFDYQKYVRYFVDPNNDPTMPEKFGYWLGYLALKALKKEYSVQEMMNWDTDKAKQLTLAVIHKLIGGETETDS